MKMNHSYTASGFKTTGNWIIPFILGWSKSFVMMGDTTIGTMYTIHITPYINIGFNDLNPKSPKRNEHSRCDCGCCDHDVDFYSDEPLSPEHKTAFMQADKFANDADPTKVFGYYPQNDRRLFIDDVTETPEDDKETLSFVFFVSDLSVEIPENFNGIKTKKEVSSPFIPHEDPKDDIPY